MPRRRRSCSLAAAALVALLLPIGCASPSATHVAVGELRIRDAVIVMVDGAPQLRARIDNPSSSDRAATVRWRDADAEVERSFLVARESSLELDGTVDSSLPGLEARAGSEAEVVLAQGFFPREGDFSQTVRLRVVDDDEAVGAPRPTGRAPATLYASKR